jgi:hypothetical protein
MAVVVRPDKWNIPHIAAGLAAGARSHLTQPFVFRPPWPLTPIPNVHPVAADLKSMPHARRPPLRQSSLNCHHATKPTPLSLPPASHYVEFEAALQSHADG